MQILVAGDRVFDGEIDIGCGTQVFDYCKTIVVTKISATPRGLRQPAGGLHNRVKKKPMHLSATPVMDNVDLLSDHSEEPSPKHSLDLSEDGMRIKHKQVYVSLDVFNSLHNFRVILRGALNSRTCDFTWSSQPSNA